MMPLVKHITCWGAPIIFTAIGRLHHHQRMIRDNNIGAFCPADRFFDKAAIIMRAGSMDTFAAPVSQPDSLSTAKQIK